MLIIPAIDIINNKIVRLTKGDYNIVKNYSISVLSQIEEYAKHKFRFVHIIDLMASKEEKICVLNLLKDIIQKSQISIQFGGGIRSIEDVERLFDIGVKRLIIGSLAVKNKPLFEKIVSVYNPNNFIVAADVKDYSVMTKGWTEDSTINIFSHIEYCKSLGLNNYLCTDIDKDGMLAGVNVSLYKEIKKLFPEIFLIASGGISCINDIKELNENKIDSCVVGKAIYEGKIKLRELKEFDY
jgi:phosphoribosylformimino-5-aminoimidazole carboxamide ribotide isomerase